jgi:hypothetical protein
MGMPHYAIWLGKVKQPGLIEAPDAVSARRFWCEGNGYDSVDHAAIANGVEPAVVRAVIATAAPFAMTEGQPAAISIRETDVQRSAEAAHAMLREVQARLLHIHPSQVVYTLGSDTWVALGEAIGALGKLRALVGRDIDVQGEAKHDPQ